MKFWSDIDKNWIVNMLTQQCYCKENSSVHEMVILKILCPDKISEQTQNAWTIAKNGQNFSDVQPYIVSGTVIVWVLN